MDHNNTIADLERTKERLKDTYLREVEILDQAIRLFKSMSSGSNGSSQVLVDSGNALPSKYAGYDRSKGYKYKIAAVLKAEERFMNIGEISDVIHSLEPEISVKDIKNAVGGAKSSLLKENAIVKYVIGNSFINSFYGSKNWLDENGDPKPEHMYNKDLLINTKEEIQI